MQSRSQFGIKLVEKKLQRTDPSCNGGVVDCRFETLSSVLVFFVLVMFVDLTCVILFYLLLMLFGCCSTSLAVFSLRATDDRVPS